MKYIKKLRAVNWKGLIFKIKMAILHRLGRFAANIVRPVLQFYYTLRDPEASFVEKLLIYACLVYMVWPYDLLPQLVYRIVGTADDIVVLSFVMRYVKNHIPPTANSKVEQTLNRWFGVQCSVGI